MANRFNTLVAVSVALAFALTPVFINANTVTAPGFGIVGTNCLVKVYHTNFAFPAEGGKIVQIGSEMFFWKNYLPQCANAVASNAVVVSSTPPASQTTLTNLSGSYGVQLADSPCAVRVYHTNFNLPAEGGHIVKIGQEMFFIRSYRPECAGAGQGGTVISATPRQPVVIQSTPLPTPTPVTPVCY